MKAVVDTWSPEKAAWYFSRGYTHCHGLIEIPVADPPGHHPTKVVWLKHIARTSFNLDRGPQPDLGHQVTPGVDYEFTPNWSMLYSP